MERKEERVMARQSIFKFNERVTTEAKDATYEFRGPVISVKNLEKKFGEHEVLKDISFDLFEGDVVCIIGSSGSGKSTLLRCINHLETPTSGQILYHGYPLTKDAQTINRFRSQVGMVFQQFNLFNNMTVFDNMYNQAILLRLGRQGETAVGIRYGGTDEYGIWSLQYYRSPCYRAGFPVRDSSGNGLGIQ